MGTLYFMVWWLYALMDAGYQENYWEAVAANQIWYNTLHHLIESHDKESNLHARKTRY